MSVYESAFSIKWDGKMVVKHKQEHVFYYKCENIVLTKLIPWMKSLKLPNQAALRINIKKSKPSYWINK